MSDYLRFMQMLQNGGVLDGARLLGRKTVRFLLISYQITTCDSDRVETGLFFVPGLPHVVAHSRRLGKTVQTISLLGKLQATPLIRSRHTRGRRPPPYRRSPGRRCPLARVVKSASDLTEVISKSGWIDS